MKLVLPFPPSGNGRNKSNGRGGYYNSPQYTAYKDEVRIILYNERVTRLEGPVRVRIDIYWTKHEPDGDNVEKSLFDSLKRLAFEDDSKIVDCHWRKFKDKDKNPRIEIEIEPAY